MAFRLTNQGETSLYDQAKLHLFHLTDAKTYSGKIRLYKDSTTQVGDTVDVNAANFETVAFDPPRLGLWFDEAYSVGNSHLTDTEKIFFIVPPNNLIVNQIRFGSTLSHRSTEGEVPVASFTYNMNVPDFADGGEFYVSLFEITIEIEVEV